MSLNRFFIGELFPTLCVLVPWWFYFFVSIASSPGNYFTLRKSEIFDAAAMRHSALRDARRGGIHATCLVSFPSRTREESTTIRLVHGRAVGINADQ